jgi:ATP-dependent DNA helicase RecQ
MALTATATPRVRREIESSLALRHPVRVIGSFDRPNLTWWVQKARGHGHKLAVLGKALRGRKGATIVYASTRRTVEAVRRSLAARGVPALSYHAALSPGRRSQVQDRFLHTPAPVVVATNAFGMVIDRPDVRLVAHVQLPGSLEAYYQEAGRAGRDGEPARCLALHGPQDRMTHDRFVATAYPHARVLWRILRHLKKEAAVGIPLPVPLKELRGLLGGGAGEEEVLAALGALSRCGALELQEWTGSPCGAGGPGGTSGTGSLGGTGGPGGISGPGGPSGTGSLGGTGGPGGISGPGRPGSLGGRGGGHSMPSPEDSPRLHHTVTLRAGSPDLAGLDNLRRLARERVEAAQAYAKGRGCRRNRLLRYFGEVPASRGCGLCDGCRAGWRGVLARRS